jgi:hypothetical protein
MLAAAQPFNGVLREYPNELAFAALFGLPLGNSRIPASHALKERLWRPHELERGLGANLNFNREMAVLVINNRRLLNERNTVKQPIHIGPSTNPRLPERVHSGTANLNERKPLTFVSLGLLAGVASSRRPARTLINAVGSPTPIPFDNDNEPMREAAHVMA